MKHWFFVALTRSGRVRPQTPTERLVAATAGLTLLAGLLSLGTVRQAETATHPLSAPCSTACASDSTAHGGGQASPAAPRPSRTPVPARTGAVPASKPRPAVVAAAPRPGPPRMPLNRHLAGAARVPAGVDRTTAAAIGRMQLSAPGYRAFLRGIDRSHFTYAQRFVEFDPRRVPIEQGRSEVFVWHFTAFYRNASGESSEPVGRMAIRPFIKTLAQRGDNDTPSDHVCCGVNWLIDRHGPAHQLAPLHAKLRHNPPYDAVNTGVEIEAARQSAITTKQYESAAYLTIAVLDAQGLLGRFPLSQIVKGHGEMRDAHLERNPDSHWGQRNDFDAPESQLLRQVIQAFLAANPEVLRMEPPLR